MLDENSWRLGEMISKIVRFCFQLGTVSEGMMKSDQLDSQFFGKSMEELGKRYQTQSRHGLPHQTISALLFSARSVEWYTSAEFINILFREGRTRMHTPSRHQAFFPVFSYNSKDNLHFKLSVANGTCRKGAKKIN